MSYPDIDWTTVFELRLTNLAGTHEDKIEAERTLKRLRMVLGEDIAKFPEIVIRNLFNLAPWTYRWLNWMSEALERVELLLGYESLRSRLGDPEKFMEAYSVLQVAERLNACALEVDFDIPVRIGLHPKVPDLRVESPDHFVKGITRISF